MGHVLWREVLLKTIIKEKVETKNSQKRPRS